MECSTANKDSTRVNPTNALVRTHYSILLSVFSTARQNLPDRLLDPGTIFRVKSRIRCGYSN